MTVRMYVFERERKEGESELEGREREQLGRSGKREYRIIKYN